ncbi:FAD-dependent monooxygenase [Nonomuraea sp. NN258]|uniref:FAD-dependent oxidoreductase n=1 Tax=Nonomuraea antri TaxID=2730852 RepID=UPI00156A30E1|nr:FAD-dependent oxidoreductase [Nonomuraea antri]NRQ38727.1 FAD-dependent monooxygenase [Nonomuraea antri]
MRVLVAGAGISGLAAARGLAAAGHEVTVLEQAEGPRLGGGAITLWPNGTAVLADLGVDLEDMGQRLATMRLRTAGDRRVVECDLDVLARRFGAAARVVPRGSLITRLLGGLPEGSVRFGVRIEGLRADGDGVLAVTGDGREFHGDFLVGADGVHSRVRALVLEERPAALTGAAIWQGLTPAPFELGQVTTLMIGRQGDAGYMGAGDGLMQWFFEFRWSPADPPPRRPVEMLRRRFAGWAEPVPRILASLSDGDAQFFRHTRHRVPRRWGDGRCVLLGDAAHGMPPVGAQGTNQGLEDVAALLDCLATTPPGTVVTAYSARRRRQAERASAFAANALRVSGPLTLMQSEGPMRLMSVVPPRLATQGFGGLLRTLSGRI